MKIIIEKPDAKYTEKRFGDRVAREQVGHIPIEGETHPRRFIFGLPDSMPSAYQAGEYEISSRSFRVGKYDKLELNPFQLHLVPVSQSVKAVA